MNYPLKLMLLAALFLSSCDNNLDFFDGDIENPDLSGEVQGPLGYYTFTTNDLIDELSGSDSDIIIDRASDGGISLVFNESFSLQDDFSFSEPIDDVIIERVVESPLASENSIFGTSDEVTVTALNFSIISQFNAPQSITVNEILDFQGNNISKLDFKNSNLNVVVSSNAKTSADIQISIPSLLSKASNTPLDFSLDVPNQGQVSQSFDLSDFEADFTFDGSNYNEVFNNFFINTVTTLDIKLGDVLSKNDAFDIRFELIDIDFNIIYGIIAKEQQSVSLPEIELDFFEDIGIDELSISGASIEMLIANSLGVAFNLDIQNSIFTNAAGNSQNLVLNDSPKRIDQATYSSATNEVISEESQISLNKDTSNLPELLELLPTNLNINIDVETIEEPSFFAYNQSQLEGNVDVIIPFDFKIKGLEFEDNIDLEIDIAEDDIDQFESAELHINIGSNFPLDISTQLQFLDASDALLDSIIFYDNDGVAYPDNRIDLIKGNDNFESATRKTIGTKENYVIIKLNKESIDDILEIKYLQLKIDVDTVGENEVKFFDDYKLDLQVGTSVNFKTN